MGSVENPNLPKENDGDTAARPFTDRASELKEESFDVTPGKSAPDRTGIDQLKGAPMPSPELHGTEI